MNIHLRKFSNNNLKQYEQTKNLIKCMKLMQRYGDFGLIPRN